MPSLRSGSEDGSSVFGKNSGYGYRLPVDTSLEEIYAIQQKQLFLSGAVCVAVDGAMIRSYRKETSCGIEHLLANAEKLREMQQRDVPSVEPPAYEDHYEDPMGERELVGAGEMATV